MTPMDAKALDPKDAAFKIVEAIEADCHEQRLFLGTVNAKEVIRNHITTYLAAIAQPAAPSDHAGLETILRDFHRNSCYPDAMDFEVSAAVEAIAALSGVGPVAVKPLEWRYYPDAFPPMWVSQNAAFGNYSIEEAAGSDSPSYDVLNPTVGLMANVDGLPEAKAAAQADYERRILAALATPPAQGDATQPRAVGWVLVPKAALDWLNGEGPDQSGQWFGDVEVGSDKRYWWRRKFFDMIETLPASPAASQEGTGR